MTLDEIFAQWDADGVIDRTDLGEEAARVPQLHSKYWKMFLAERKVLRERDVVFKKLRLDKTEFYTLGPHSGTPKDWQLPACGRVTKSEVEKYLEIDVHVVSAALKLAEQRDKVDLLQAILDSIKGRNWEIGRKIEWVKWSGGAS